MKQCFILILILLFPYHSESTAQDPSPGATINGSLVDASSRLAIDMADILLIREGEDLPSYQSLPAPDGSFVLRGVRSGAYTLMVRLIGYDIYSREGIVVGVGQGSTGLGIIPLKPLELGLAEVEVVASRKQIVYKIDRRVIEASSNLMAGGGSAVDILENTPSIRVDADGELTFRGSSGFTVYVDGKPSVFSGAQALRHISSAQVENIEVITTPSARYDTGGDTGIINIITRKETASGISGMVNLSASTFASRSADFLITGQGGNSRWIVGGNASDRLLKSHFDQDKTTAVGEQITHSHSNGPRMSDNFSYSMRAGWQYDSKPTSISADIEGGYGGRLRRGDLDYTEEHLGPGGDTSPTVYLSRDYYHIDETFFTGSVTAAHDFGPGGGRINGLLYIKYGGDALEYFQSDLMQGDERRMGHRAYEDEHRWTARANADYTLPIDKTAGKLETGYQYYSYLEDGDYSMEFWIPERGRFEFRTDDHLYNNIFYFLNGIHSLYAIGSGEVDRFSWQAGLRAEYTHRVLRTDVPGANRTYDDIHLFPSVHMGLSMGGDRLLMASYSRRITRPDLFYMEPYITYRDFYSAEIGNPDISNEFIDAYELNYKASLGTGSISATAFYRRRTGKIERLRIPYEGAIREGVTLDSMANVGNDYSSGIELYAQAEPIKHWNTTLAASLYHYRIVNKLSRDARDVSSANYDITLSNTIDLTRQTRLQADGIFSGPTVTTQGRTDAFWYINVALRHNFKATGLSASIAARDILNSARYTSIITTSDLRSVTAIRSYYPLITLSLSYTFNRYTRQNDRPGYDRDLFEGTRH
jgi:outer membrane receptor protein involved in Fe transport